MQIKQRIGATPPARFERLPAIGVVLGPAPEALASAPHGEALRKLAAKADVDTVRAFDQPDGRLALIRPRPDGPAFDWLTAGRKLAGALLEDDPKEIALAVLGFDTHAKAVAEAALAALLAGAHRLPSFKAKAPKPRRLTTVHLWGPDEVVDTARLLAEAEGNALARDLTALPANHLTPAIYRERIATLAHAEGWEMRFLGVQALRRMGAGAFLAVAQGSTEQDAGIVHLRYAPTRGMRKSALALVGKGICFDTGGVNLKAARHMHGMHQDMAGSAVALGALLALSRLKVGFPVDCWLALAQNPIGPAAYKQGDVVTAANGTTIEVVHTDAEGRMVLADALALASGRKPGLLVDYATLTGSMITALGTAYSGALTNREDLLPTLIAAGRDSGERVWPFPCDQDFDAQLESDIADVKQCTLESDADHILAARFLGRFVAPGVPWVHLDLASAANKGGLAHVPTDITGFGVRYSLSLLLDHHAMELP
ncbi:MAG: leucyl aminopeptidase family protein [Thiohalomonadaceae bacterium]